MIPTPQEGQVHVTLQQLRRWDLCTVILTINSISLHVCVTKSILTHLDQLLRYQIKANPTPPPHNVMSFM